MGDLSVVLAADKGTADYWYGGNSMATLAGVGINADTAMKISAVYAAVRAISETVGAVPKHVYQVTGADGDGKREARNHPLEDLVARSPNRYQTALEFFEMMTAFAMLRKFAIAEIRSGARGAVDQIVPLHPDLVREETLADGTRRYQYRDPLLNRERPLLDDEVLILRGPFGKSVLDFARDSFGLALALEQAAAQLAGRGVRSPGAIHHPKLLSDKARENLRKALDEYSAGGSRAGRAMLLEEGMTWESISITPEQAQFLDSRKWSVADVVRWFRVPLHKIGELTRSTNNNIEHQGLEWVTDTIMPWAERWEQVISRDLILAPDRFFVEFNLDGLNRGDIASRYEAYAMGRQWGWLATNEIRRKENLNPIPGGDDDYLTPLNMTTGADGKTAVLEWAPRPSAEAVARLRLMARDAAGRAVRKESAAIAKLAERTGGAGDEWRTGVSAFYGEHGEFVARLLRIPDDAAAAYAASRANHVLAHGPAGLVDEDLERVSSLTRLALSSAEPLALPASSAA